MKYLIFGASGFIGTDVVGRLLAENRRMLLFRNKRAFPAYVEKSPLVKIVPIQEGLNDMSLFDETDTLLFFAGERLTENFDGNSLVSNIDLLNRVLQPALSAGVKEGVFLSTIGVYSGENRPWKEGESERPGNLYALSKLVMDDILLECNKKHATHFKSLRLAQVMGIGERKGYVLNTFFECAMNNSPLTILGSGEGRRQFIYIDDVVDAIIHSSLQRGKGGVYNIGMEHSLSISEMAHSIRKWTDSSSPVFQQPYDREDVNVYEMDITKAAEELNWSPDYTFSEAVVEMKNRYLDAGKNLHNAE